MIVDFGSSGLNLASERLLLGASRRRQGNGQKWPPPREAKSFAWPPQHDARPCRAAVTDEGCSEEPSFASWPPSPEMYEFPFWQVIRASLRSRDEGVIKRAVRARGVKAPRGWLCKGLAWSCLHVAVSDWCVSKAVTRCNSIVCPLTVYSANGLVA